ncbi:LuxR C-terminal-related transcriptional regulator [Piscinibacter sakaiensis]|uniref:Response regulator n=1 Tax=Piscinibacter sakaiensis TaxID=1547922 RepID=A0A0K8P2W9_PISS1|nr:LuxR C-terminal-related transcriptional regulator [Piscinibacter sakaiensis]GAP37022.1 response regulator [Piscinibacter sakaiensis]
MTAPPPEAPRARREPREPREPETPAEPAAIDYRIAFDLAPVGLVLSRQRRIVDCNQALLDIFGAPRERVVGRSFALLYPSHDEFERTGARIVAQLDRRGTYADDRVMKRVGGERAGELFWCHVAGRALDARQPHAAGIWSFEDLSATRRLKADLTPREREIAALLIEGLTSKLIGRRLGISPRTVDVYRSRLMKKIGAATTPELVKRLLSA